MKRYLGIELGSTRIKAVLIDENCAVLASGAHTWENKLEEGHWTYSMEDVRADIKDAYAKLASEYQSKFGEPLASIDGMGVSAMMHGYLAFDKDGKQLTAFRTWRNTTTEQAATQLTELFGFHIPQRWSVAHLYQVILNKEPHVEKIAFLTTLAGYVHLLLTGERVLGVGDASGMFPIDSLACNYDANMAKHFEELTGIDVMAILPRVLIAGEKAGILTPEGARLLDPSGILQPGVPLCPPEGDAGTGMVATNSIAARTGNVSAGTSAFSMVVLEKPLSRLYKEIDMVTTPAGLPVAMVHSNSCTSDLDAWVNLLGEAAALMGAKFSKPELYDALYAKMLDGEPDVSGLLSYNYYSGEPVAGLAAGRPLFVRLPDSRMSLANFMRLHLYSSIAALSLGMDFLVKQENVKLDELLGHGGFFKTKGVGQQLMASALNIPVVVRETAAEGGAWGIALLASYLAKAGSQTLEQYLDGIFANSDRVRAEPDEKDTEGFRKFMRRYMEGLEIERAAVEKF
ncbi:MAG: FGGY-family carbohydrate kinase [Clostridiales bacterium]|nr:FGGY-family carbohydrate kinase [Clostridiales bacterium]